MAAPVSPYIFDLHIYRRCGIKNWLWGVSWSARFPVRTLRSGYGILFRDVSFNGVSGSMAIWLNNNNNMRSRARLSRAIISIHGCEFGDLPDKLLGRSGVFIAAPRVSIHWANMIEPWFWFPGS